MPSVPSRLADEPVAALTTWEPLVGGGANFKTRRLVPVDGSRVEFPASAGARLFVGVFGAFGVGSLAFAIGAGHWAPALFGVAFTGIGAALWWFGTTPVVFDRRQGAFWRGRTAPNETVNRAALKHYALLADIHALQILEERVASDDGAYSSYELNLVLRDGRRLNVMDHGDYEALRADAATMGTFLGCPVWDAAAGSEG